jgi:DNA-binding response OmpR family regulator
MTNNKKNRLLAVDDDILFLKILNEWFSFKGFNITTANSGDDTLAILEQNDFDAILLDVMLRHTSGLDILEKIKENPKTKDIPVFIISQIGEAEHKERAKKLGAVDYLVKANFSLKDLTEKVKKVIK